MSIISPSKLLVLSAFFLALGLFKLNAWTKIFEDRNHPVVTGRVTERLPMKLGGPAQVVFKIELDNSTGFVTAHARQSLLDKVPDRVRFRYSGDPKREVFLFEHEENPLWLALVYLAVCLLSGVSGLYWLLASSQVDARARQRRVVR